MIVAHTSDSTFGTSNVITQVPLLQRFDPSTGVHTPVQGPEVKDGERWRKVLESCPGGSFLLGIDLFSDAVMAGAVSRL
jgi:hypothetical protein